MKNKYNIPALIIDDTVLLTRKTENQKSYLIRNYYNQIIPNLYLGDLNKALDSQKEFDIIINLSGYDYFPLAPTKIYTFDIDDHSSSDIIEPINLFLPIIDEGLSLNKKILVHCLMGLSRSPSIIVAYLMKKNSWSFDEAVKFVNSKRTHPININFGFTHKLNKFNSD